MSTRRLDVVFPYSNGHMLTHRNKKPYECKAEGCGKSYCDARSLRRHTENHHSTPATTTTSTATVSAVTVVPAGEDAPIATCIQYAPPPPPYPSGSPPATTQAPSQLQQLLSAVSEPTSSTSSSQGTSQQVCIQYIVSTYYHFNCYFPMSEVRQSTLYLITYTVNSFSS